MQLKPFGVALGLLGNVMIALAIAKLIDNGSCGGDFAPACPSELTPYVIMLPAGIIISVAAIFFGGGGFSFLGVFLAVGIGALLAGFQSEDPDTQSFGKVFGAGFAGVPLLIIGLTLLAGRSGASKMKRAQSLIATGARGTGTVAEVRDTGVTINDNPRVEVTMSVLPEAGGAAFPLKKTVTVSRVAIPRAGDRFPVWYDPADADNWAYGTDLDPTKASTDVQALFAKAQGVGSPHPTPAADGPADELMKLNELRLKGVLTEEEFAAAKARVLGTSP